MGRIWLTSDTHFCHNKEFCWIPRGFKNQWEMNEVIIKKWNSLIAPDDKVYLLGDVMLCDNEKGMQCLKSLQGNIHIIRGNHCSDNRVTLYQTAPNVIEVCDAKFLRYKKYHFFLSHYPAITANCDENKSLHSQMINLCGHSHTQDRFVDINKGLIYHVELDAHNCYPIDIEWIIKDIKNFLGRK